jgi:hypothetical protein
LKQNKIFYEASTHWCGSDKGTGSRLDLTFYCPHTHGKFYSTGTVFTRGKNSSNSPYALLVKDNGDGSVKAPVSWTQTWNDRKSGGRLDTSFWIPNCPRGYVGLGVVGVTQSNSIKTGPKSAASYRCVKKSLTVRSTIGN